MYTNVLLASDGARESLIALREGALIAAAFKSRVYLLIIDPETGGTAIGESVLARPADRTSFDLLELGLARLKRLGVEASGSVVAGEPAREIAARARALKADLIVVGHRRQTFMERWWSGAAGGYIVDSVACSVMVARNMVSDEAFERHLMAPTTD